MLPLFSSETDAVSLPSVDDSSVMLTCTIDCNPAGTSRKISSCGKVRTPNPYILLEPDTTMISVAHFTVLPFDWRA